MNLNDPKRSPLSKKAGFTLMEMILVIALLMLLAGVAIVNLGGIFGQSQVKVTTVKIENYKTPLFRYRMDMGSYPTTEQGLKVLLEKPANDNGRWKGPYIEGNNPLLDAWERELKYKFPSSNVPGSYELYSMGEDGVESADDIKNWK